MIALHLQGTRIFTNITKKKKSKLYSLFFHNAIFIKKNNCCKIIERSTRVKLVDKCQTLYRQYNELSVNTKLQVSDILF